jgi:LysR family transcriptional regulator, regulator for bpeEF and oprC
VVPLLERSAQDLEAAQGIVRTIHQGNRGGVQQGRPAVAFTRKFLLKAYCSLQAVSMGLTMPIPKSSDKTVPLDNIHVGSGMSIDRLSLWQTYVRVIETGSFSAVAKELGTLQPRVSKQIAALEAQLGVRLLRRSTRKLSMTQEGERLYAEARRIVQEVGELESQLKGGGEPLGTLRVACPPVFARIKLLPHAAAFLDQYPQLGLEFSVHDHFVDLVEDGIDVAIRIGEIAGSDLHGRRIGTARRICVGAPRYLQKHGTPNTPADLHAHHCIIYTLLATGATWPFDRMPVKVSGRVRGNSPEVVLTMAINGLGIAMAPAFLFTEALAAGELREILKSWTVPGLPIYALYLARRYLPGRIRLFVDHLARAFATDHELRT